jgi:hypothetical protein
VWWLLFRGSVESPVLPFWGSFWIGGALSGMILGILAEIAPKSGPVRLGAWLWDQCASISEDEPK